MVQYEPLRPRPADIIHQICKTTSNERDNLICAITCSLTPKAINDPQLKDF